MKRDVGQCERCGVRFAYQIIHNGFNDTAYAYCDRCGMTAFVGGWHDSRRPKEAPLRIHEPILPETEPYLESCVCGGRFRHEASPRCPRCHEPLSAEAATEWIERNAPGTRKGWRWQRNWSGVYCLIVEQRFVENNWRRVGTPSVRFAESSSEAAETARSPHGTIEQPIAAPPAGVNRQLLVTYVVANLVIFSFGVHLLRIRELGLYFFLLLVGFPASLAVVPISEQREPVFRYSLGSLPHVWAANLVAVALNCALFGLLYRAATTLRGRRAG